MNRLAARDLNAVLGFLKENYRCLDPEGFVNHVLTALPKIIPAELVTYNEMCPETALSNNWVSPGGVVTPAIDQAWERHMNEHPVLSHNLRTGDRQALKISDFYSQAQFYRYGLYADFYRLMGIEDVLCCVLSAPRTKVIGLALHRAKRTFTDRDRSLLNLLRPHLGQAWCNARVAAGMNRRLLAYSQALKSLKQGIVSFTREGKVDFMSPVARDYLVRYFNLSRAIESKLPAKLETWIRQQESHFPAGEIGHPRLPFTVDRDNSRLVIHFFSEPNCRLLIMQERSMCLETFRAKPREWAARIKRESSAKCMDTSGLEELSPRELEVLGWIAGGKSNFEIAVILSDGPNKIHPLTVKKHAENIFRKLGVGNRHAAAEKLREALGRMHL